MNRLLKKLYGNKSGYTLAELLVVVAIIGILITVSVPAFTAQIGKARKVANQANLRAARAAAVADYLGNYDNAEESVVYAYDIESGTVMLETSVPSGLNDVAIDEASEKEVYKEIYIRIIAESVSMGTRSSVGREMVLLYAK